MQLRTGESYLDLRDGVRELCAQFPDVYWREHDRDRSYPSEFVQALTDSGYLAALIPAALGGSGLPLTAAAAILEEVHASGGNGAACHAQIYSVGILLQHGSEEQQRRWLPEIAGGRLRLQALAITEPTGGADTLSLRTTAERHGGSYRLRGQKLWTSRVEHTDLMLLLARTTPKEELKQKSEGLSLFVVDLRDAPREKLTIRPIRTMINHPTSEIFFDDLEIPSGNLIGIEGEGFHAILDAMNAERILLAAECIGDARWFIGKASNYARVRHVFGRPIGQNQGVQFPIARTYAMTEAAALMVGRAAGLYDDAEPCAPEANMAKLLAADASWQAAETCLQTHGGLGLAEEYDVERKFREARFYQVAPVSTNLILAYLAEHVLGLPRSY